MKCSICLLSCSAFWLILIVLHIASLFHVSDATDDDRPPQKDTSSPDADDDPPLNLVILFADNLGYDDVSCFQSQQDAANRKHSSSSSSASSSTPNIDRLAEEGMKFMNWNSAAALCSASRSALLTGKYPVRTGTYPRVFRNDATFGLLPEETTLAELLKVEGYATSIVGKWHLGHRERYLPTNQGFDSWFGIPYHMSGGSVDNHVCNSDQEETMWLPLYANTTILEQPVRLQHLASRYAASAVSFIEENTAAANHKKKIPFFLYMAFSHVHQLCAPRDFPEQDTCQWAEQQEQQATFTTAVQEMDWIAGQILDALDNTGAANNTLVLFTSDNGPWVAEQSCSGSKGPFTGQWLQDNLSESCVACPHDYVPVPTATSPKRCVLPGTKFELTGVTCGEDTGLGSVWEANLRMPAIARLPGRVPANSSADNLISTLDVIPTFLSMIGKPLPVDLDGLDMSEILTGTKKGDTEDRILFFWRDGFQEGPLGPPWGRFDIAAVKLGNLKAWFWTKSAHYNEDVEQFHDPPLLFDTMKDPAESRPLDPLQFEEEIEAIKLAVEHHKQSLDWTYPLALYSDPAYLPCVDRSTKCRTHDGVGTENSIS